MEDKNKQGWIIIENKKYYFVAKYYSEGIGEYNLGGKKLIKPIADYQVYAKWDGCIEFDRFFNGDDSGSEENTDGMHICDIDEVIKRLKEIKQLMVNKGFEL
jgi:hypothetical protein